MDITCTSALFEIPTSNLIVPDGDQTRTRHIRCRLLVAMGSIIAKSGHVVGALACQRDSYLQTLDSEVISCVELPPQKPAQNSSKGKTKVSTDPSKNGSPSTGSKIWQIEFADSVLFPEGKYLSIPFPVTSHV